MGPCRLPRPRPLLHEYGSRATPMQSSRVRPMQADRTGSIPAPVLSHRATLAPAVPGHTVQFYKHEDFLATTVADFIATGIAADQSAVIIATEAHRQAFSLRLKAKGF